MCLSSTCQVDRLLSVCSQYCQIEITEVPGTDKVSWWLGVGLQDAWLQHPDKPPNSYFKSSAMAVRCNGANFF